MALAITFPEKSKSYVSLKGRFDAHEADRVAAVFAGLLAAGKTDIELDLSETVFIDSTALAELVRAMKRAREAEGDVTIMYPSQPVQIILELTAFDKAFTIVSEQRKDLDVSAEIASNG